MSTKTLILESTGKPFTYPVPYDPIRSFVKIDSKLLVCCALAWDNKELAAFFRAAGQAFVDGDPSIFASQRYVEGFRFYRVAVRRCRYISREVRQSVLSAGQCAHCGGTQRLTVDHILAVARGGDSRISNLQCLCHWCNCRKGAKLV